MPSLGSFCARRARRSKYSWAVMPGVTGARRVTMLLLMRLLLLLLWGWLELEAWNQGVVGSGGGTNSLHSPGLRMCGCVSCTGCPNWRCAAETEA